MLMTIYECAHLAIDSFEGDADISASSPEMKKAGEVHQSWSEAW